MRGVVKGFGLGLGVLSIALALILSSCGLLQGLFNRPPVAVIIASLTSRFVPLKVEFDGSNSYDQPESSVPTPGNDEKVLTVGAIYHGDWTTGPQEPYSSQGPTNDSQYAASRTKPDLMGPDGVSNYTYTAFYGTSASSPHVAGAAALLLSEDPSRTAAQLQAKLEVDAIDMGWRARIIFTAQAGSIWW